jgi:hypothetical protein
VHEKALIHKTLTGILVWGGGALIGIWALIRRIWYMIKTKNILFNEDLLLCIRVRGGLELAVSCEHLLHVEGLIVTLI